MKTYFLVLLAVVYSFPVLAEEIAEEIIESSNARSNRIVGKVELRPTWVTSSGLFETRNNVDLGYQFDVDTKLFYSQSINTNVYSPTADLGLNPAFPDARLEADFNNIWTSKRFGVALDYQPRLHLPVDAAKRDLGMITEVRNQFNATKRFSDDTSLVVSWIPVIHVYSRRGGFVNGEATANPVIENRVEVAGVFHPLSDKLVFTLPLRFYQTKYGDFLPDAKFQDRWVTSVSVKPEVLYQLTPELIIGAAWETDNLVDDDFSGLNVTEGLRKSAVQAVLIANL